MPRPKRPSDERYNERRRARREAERAQREGRYEDAARLREQVSASYVKKKPVQQGANAVQRIDRVATSQREPRKKRPSDELYNARRRLRRQAEKLEREAKKLTGREKKLQEGYAQYLRQQAAPTGKRMSEQQRMEALERLQRIREATRETAYGKFGVARRNAIIMQQLNAAGTKGADSSISERKKDVFWAATKGLWPEGSHVARNQRYERILQHFYSENTSDALAFRAWLEEQKGTNAQNSFGDLQLVFEYLTEVMNDPAVYAAPEIPYQQAMDLIKMAK